MIYDVRITAEAENDLRLIFEYIHDELREPVNALGQLERLEERILRLDQFPNRYRRYDREPWKSRGLRIMPVDSYLVFFIPDDAAHEVNVIRVLYGGRDLQAVLDKMTE